MPSEQYVARSGSASDDMRMIPARFAWVRQRSTRCLNRYFPSIFQELRTIGKTCNQLPAYIAHHGDANASGMPRPRATRHVRPHLPCDTTSGARLGHTHTQFMVGRYSALDCVPAPQRDQRYADGTAIPHAPSRWRLATMGWDGRRTGWPHRCVVSAAPCLPWAAWSVRPAMVVGDLPVPRGGHGRTVATPAPPSVPCPSGSTSGQAAPGARRV